MAQVKEGDTVKVHYTGKLEDGEIFDTSQDGDPLEFEIGGGKVIPGFEQSVVGMIEGESKTVEIPSDEAYGPHHQELVLDIEMDQFPKDLDPEVGQQFKMRQPDGRAIIVAVTEITEDSVTLDANHPLAGKDLTFDIQLIEII